MTSPKLDFSNYKMPSKDYLHEIIFEAETTRGKLFDIILLVCIVLSVLAVVLETVPSLNDKYHTLFIVGEWTFTIVFTIEYALRIYAVQRPKKYIFSFFGVIDLLSILPTYLTLIIAATPNTFLMLRALRLLRIFRIFKLANFIVQSKVIGLSLRRSLSKIAVFLYFILILVTIFGGIMYLVEGDVNPQFKSIPTSIYWAIVTITTVGYGDISPITPFGQFLSAIIMVLGYAVIAVPTGIVSAEMIKGKPEKISTEACRYCAKEGHENDAEFCKFCGEKLNEDKI